MDDERYGEEKKQKIDKMAITLKEGELSSSDAAMSWVDMSGFHCRTEQFLLFESEKLVNGFWFLKSQTIVIPLLEAEASIC